MEAEFPASIICTWAEEAEGSKAGGDRLTGRREQGSYAEKAAWGAGTAANDLPLRTLWWIISFPGSIAGVDVNSNMSRKVSSFQKCEANDKIT